jgi:hypothetical protein
VTEGAHPLGDLGLLWLWRSLSPGLSALTVAVAVAVAVA